MFLTNVIICIVIIYDSIWMGSSVSYTVPVMRDSLSFALETGLDAPYFKYDNGQRFDV